MVVVSGKCGHLKSWFPALRNLGLGSWARQERIEKVTVSRWFLYIIGGTKMNKTLFCISAWYNWFVTSEGTSHASTFPKTRLPCAPVKATDTSVPNWNLTRYEVSYFLWFLPPSNAAADRIIYRKNIYICQVCPGKKNLQLRYFCSLSLGFFNTSSTAQGGGGSFKNRKPIGEVGCCESGIAERSHWWSERWLISLTISLSFSDYLPTYQPIFYVSMYLSIYLSLFHLSICLSVYLSIYLSIYLSVCLSVYLSTCLSLSICGAVSFSVR